MSGKNFESYSNFFERYPGRAITAKRLNFMDTGDEHFSLKEDSNNSNKKMMMPKFESDLLEDNLIEMESNLCKLMDSENGYNFSESHNFFQNNFKNFNQMNVLQNVTNSADVGKGCYRRMTNTPDLKYMPPTPQSMRASMTSMNEIDMNCTPNKFTPNANQNPNPNEELKTIKLRNRTVTFFPVNNQPKSGSASKQQRSANSTTNDTNKMAFSSPIETQRYTTSRFTNNSQQQAINTTPEIQFSSPNFFHNTLSNSDKLSSRHDICSLASMKSLSQFGSSQPEMKSSPFSSQILSIDPLSQSQNSLKNTSFLNNTFFGKDLVTSSPSSIASLSSSPSFSDIHHMQEQMQYQQNGFNPHANISPLSSANTTACSEYNTSSPQYGQQAQHQHQQQQQQQLQQTPRSSQRNRNYYYNNKKSVKMTVPSSKRQVLEEEFRKEKYPSNDKLQKLSVKLNMRYDEVQNYFKKRRREEKETNNKFSNLVNLLNNYLEQED